MGFADATPSEGIQKHYLPRAAVGVIFPILNGSNALNIPVKQYKDASLDKRLARRMSSLNGLTNKKL